MAEGTGDKIGEVYVEITANTSRFDAGVSNVATKTRHLDTSMKGIQDSSFNAGRSILYFSQALEDAQYGLAGVLNNIPQLVGSLGGTAGLAGIISVVSVGVFQLTKHWDDLMSVFGSGKVRTEAEEMEELAKKTAKTADEAERLYRFQQLQAKTTELRQAKTVSEKTSEELATKAITEAGIKNIVSGILKNAPNLLDTVGGVPMALEKLKKESSMFVGGKSVELTPEEIGRNPARLRRVMEAQEELNQARRAAAETITSASTLTQLFPRGPGQLAGLMARNPGDFGPHAMATQEALENAQKKAEISPEERQAKKVGDILTKALAKFRTEFEKKADAQIKKDEHEADQAAKKEESEAFAYFEKLGHERERKINDFAVALNKALGKLLLANPNADLEAFIKERLKIAGAHPGMAGDIGEKIRESLDQEVKKRAAAEEITPEQARARILKDRMTDEREEAKAKLAKEGGIRQSERLTTEAFFNKIQAAALSPEGKTQAELAANAKRSVEFLEQIAGNTAKGKGGARFGGGPAKRN